MKSSSTDLTPPVEMQQGGESTTCGALQTSEKYARPRTHLEPIDQTVESRRREVRWNTSRENLPRTECRQSDDGRIHQATQCRQLDDPEPSWTQPSNSSHVLVGSLSSARRHFNQENFFSPVRPLGLDTHLHLIGRQGTRAEVTLRIGKSPESNTARRAESSTGASL